MPWLQIAFAGSLAAVIRSVAADGGGWFTLLCVNLAGCALLGALVARGRATPVLAGGFCGSLTTFSGVMFQARATTDGDRLGAWSSHGDWLALPGGASGALLLISVSACAGLVAFMVARSLTPDTQRERPAVTT